MTNRERLVKYEAIERRQRIGKITPEQASAEFDEIFYQSSVDEGNPELVYYSDSTGLTAEWDSDLMLFPMPGKPHPTLGSIASNTGIYARGPRRGEIVTTPEGAEPNCSLEVLAHFKR